MLQIRRILQMMSNGQSNRSIARELHLSRDAVSNYVNLLKQLNISFDKLLNLEQEEFASLIYPEQAFVEKDRRFINSRLYKII